MGRATRRHSRFGKQRSRHPRRLRLEPLEDRRLLNAGTLYVDADAVGAGSGENWTDAFADLQPALAAAAVLNGDADLANDVDSIWIAEGTYTPSALLQSGDARSASFSLLDGVALYGGFAGTETTPDARDWSDHVTTLSGDLGTLEENFDNAYTVVYGGENIEAAMDGIAITGGNADGSKDDSSRYERSKGGGIYNAGTLTVTNSTLSGNSADRYGGGIYNDEFGMLTVTNSTLSGNSADRYGGGIYNDEFGMLTVTNSAFLGNSAGYGGGIYNWGTLTVTNSTFLGNSTYSGGGIYNRGTLTVTNSTLSGNSATGNSVPVGGGGIYNGSGPLTVTNTIVYLNSGRDIRGSFDGSNSLVAIDPGFVRAPSAGADGVWGTDDDDLGDLRLTDRSPAINAGSNVLAVDAAGNPLATDLAGNPRIADGTVDIGAFEYQGPPLSQRETPSLVVSATDDEFDLYDGDVTLREAIYYAQSGIGNGTVTFDANLDGATITLAGRELLILNPIVIDASALSSVTVDADHRSRVFHVTDNATLAGLTITGGSADEGSGSGGGIYNSGTLTVTNSTLSGNSAGYGGGISNFGSLTVTNSTLSGNSATRTSFPVGGGGIYNEGTLTVTNTIVYLNSGRDIRGSFDGSNSLMGIDPGFVRAPSAGADGVWGTDDDDLGDLRLTDRSPAINAGSNVLAVDAAGNPLATDLAGNPRIADGTVDIGAFEYQGPPLSQRETPSLVVSATDDEFDLYDGDVTLREAIYYAQSGIGNGTVTFDANLNGATITLAGRELWIFRSIVIDASALSSVTVDADQRSGVFYVTDDVTLDGLTITGGSADEGNKSDEGGGIYNSGTLTVTNSTLSGNSADSGGGIYNSGTLTIMNSTLSDNSAPLGGGGIDNNYGTLTITNSTLSGNSARLGGGGIDNISGTLTITNSNLSGNSAGSGGGIANSSGSLTITNSTLSGNSADSGGGGIANRSGPLTITNSILSGNSADSGGGIANGSGPLMITNSTLSGNSADSGGGIYNSSGPLTIMNSIVYLNSRRDIDGSFGGSNSLIAVDPGFVRAPSAGADGVWGTGDDDFGDLRLRPDSPAIDAGSNELAVDADGNPLSTDIVGNPRIFSGAMDGAETVDVGAYEFIPPIVGSYLYYRGSRFDDGSGDGAIAADKRPLLSGQTAAAANYSNFDAGINGLMVDINGADDGYEFLEDDFLFRVGNQDDPNGWTRAPAPSLILTRPGDGVADSIRVQFAWPNGAIGNTWLEVTVRANDNTGLLDDHVFYFGNVVGETGNSTADALVNAVDVMAIRDNLRGKLNPTGIDTPFDINRDMRVDAIDVILARNAAMSPSAALRLITPAAVPALPVALGEGERESGGGMAIAAAKLRRDGDREDVASRLLGDARTNTTSAGADPARSRFRPHPEAPDFGARRPFWAVSHDVHGRKISGLE